MIILYLNVVNWQVRVPLQLRPDQLAVVSGHLHPAAAPAAGGLRHGPGLLRRLALPDLLHRPGDLHRHRSGGQQGLRSCALPGNNC